MDIGELRRLEECGLVRSMAHRELPLLVWNYTPKTQFERAFVEYPVLKQCRGLVTDLEGNVRARCYEKFFNYAEHEAKDLTLGATEFAVQWKLDGSLLLVAQIFDTVVYCTRGSFDSEQALLGSRLFREIYSEDWIEAGKTYLFELIGPSNRIVNQYPKDDLILHGILETETGLDCRTDAPFRWVESVRIEATVFGAEMYATLYAMNVPNAEGFVVKVARPGEPTWMCKIKFEEYVKIHRIVTGVSNTTVWEYLRDGRSFDAILEICPDEFNAWLRQTKARLERDYCTLEERAQTAYAEVVGFSTRKEQAMALMQRWRDMAHIVFKMLDGQDYAETIWRLVKPTRYIQPFASRGEE